MANITVRKIEVTRANGAPYYVPYWEIETGRPGPCLLVTAALHGNEIQGSEVLRRFRPLAADQLQRGSCLLLPLANLLAIQRRQPHIDFILGHYYGSDNDNNVNGAWPGKADGTNSQQLAYALYHSVVARATHNIDIHCYNGYTAAVVMARTGYEPSLQLAQATALPFASHFENHPEARQRPVYPCIQSTLFNETGRAGISIELSGQYEIREPEVRLGLRAVVNCFRRLEMLPGKPEGLEEPQVWLNDAERVKVLVPASGLFARSGCVLGQWVTAGTRLGWILSDADLREIEICAPAAGYLYQYGTYRGMSKHDTVADQKTTLHPYVSAGETLAVLVIPKKT